MDKIKRLTLITIFSVFFSLASVINCLPAAAILRQHHENSGELHYHAHSSISDKQGMTWQVVLFPEYQADIVTKYHLRLVGFPGIAEFIHPQPLEIITAQGEVFNAADINTFSTPAPNVGEFDLTEILPMLPDQGALKLSAILKDNQDLSLKLPKSILIEWKLLVNEIISDVANIQ